MRKNEPYITGFGLASPGSWTLHAIPAPLRMGEIGFALCGTIEAHPQGWIEPSAEVAGAELYCSVCITRFEQLIEEKDERLTRDDRARMALIIQDYRG